MSRPAAAPRAGEARPAEGGQPLPLTLAVATRDEARHLAGCLESVPFAAEVVVLDSGSTDGTVEIALARGARVAQTDFRGYGRLKNTLIEMAAQPWILLLDADERLTPPLAEEIREALARPGEAVAFRIPRHNYIFGRLTRGGGWYPDRQVRLFRRGCARYQPQQEVHEVLEVGGPVADLSQPIEHWNYDSWEEFVAKQRRYARLHARSLAARGVRARTWGPPLQAWREFWRRWLGLGGWREGGHGLRLCLALAYFEGLAYWWLLRGCRRVTSS